MANGRRGQATDIKWHSLGGMMMGDFRITPGFLSARPSFFFAPFWFKLLDHLVQKGLANLPGLHSNN
ncbi:hypothetical protein [Dyella caseinilytica]|uniref:Uncharacterized protein n=1 Tax=Dyella caseinilytica TaxID=1849581 RepID=A0ABX7GTB7_9GAMM|nr:hypothetical protein [Dyella caseinilytica]QRN53695.1 hypothetical protein ISN74_20245 [Dyella caseinilytica]